MNTFSANVLFDKILSVDNGLFELITKYSTMRNENKYEMSNRRASHLAVLLFLALGAKFIAIVRFANLHHARILNLFLVGFGKRHLRFIVVGDSKLERGYHYRMLRYHYSLYRVQRPYQYGHSLPLSESCLWLRHCCKNI